MKYILTLVSLVAVLYLLPACTKNNPVTIVHDTTTIFHKDSLILRDTTYITSPKHSIFGVWVGTYKINTLPNDSFYYSYAILPDNTVLTNGGGSQGTSSYSEGPWKLTGTTFTATLTTMDEHPVEDVQAIQGTYDSVGGVLKGTWRFTTGGIDGPGTFILRKVP